MSAQILGYRRANGSVGIRNYVLLLPLDAVSYQVCNAVTKIIAGTMTVYHPYGRMQFGEDLEMHFRTLIGTGLNPNVASVIVVGIEPNWTKKVAEGIRVSNKPVDLFWTDGHGDLKTIEKVSRVAQKFVQHATELGKEEINLSEMVIGLKCGESDTTSGLAGNPAVGKATDRLIEAGATLMFGETPEITGAEHILYRHFATEELGDQFLKIHKDYLEFINSKGVDLLGSQPNQGNIAGGISTIEEKALGNIQKIGSKKIVGILDTAESPKKDGLYFMNTSSAAADLLTSMAAAGAVMNLFITGKGNNVGNPICPVIKICANPKTVELVPENIDVDVSGLITGDLKLDQAEELILDSINKTANGRLTCAETLFHNEFAIARLFPQS